VLTSLLGNLMTEPRVGDRPSLRLVTSASREGDIEERAVTQLRGGDLGALGTLFDLHHGAVRTFAMRFLGDASAAEDLVQDVFVALPDAIPRYRGDAALRSFLIAMAATLSRNHVRAAARRRAMLARAALEPMPVGTGPDAELEREHLAAMLQRALDELSHDHRLTFVLCEIEERTSPEVAEILGIPEATVRTRLFHAKKKLRELLEEAR
jgi:RNA polymerase sigma-70 factor (ECF subfamily)